MKFADLKNKKLIEEYKVTLGEIDTVIIDLTRCVQNAIRRYMGFYAILPNTKRKRRLSLPQSLSKILLNLFDLICNAAKSVLTNGLKSRRK